MFSERAAFKWNWIWVPFFSFLFLSLGFVLSFVRVSLRGLYLCVLVASTWNVNKLSVAVFRRKFPTNAEQKTPRDCIIFVLFKLSFLSCAQTYNNSLNVMFNNNGSKVFVFRLDHLTTTEYFSAFLANAKFDGTNRKSHISPYFKN